MRPKTGVHVEQVARQLRDLIGTGRNAYSAGGPNPLLRRDAFLLWANDVERYLMGYFADVPLERLHTERYWRIQSMDERTARPHELISMELDARVSWLETLVHALDREAARAGDQTATIAVPDTHVLLHYRLFNEIDWAKIVGATPVRLAIPLRVVDELDEKKYARRGELGERARTVISHLERYLGSQDTPARLREGVTIEMVSVVDLAPDRYPEPTSADSAILDACDWLLTLSGAAVRLVTGDTGMRLRARDREIKVATIPESYRLPPARPHPSASD